MPTCEAGERTRLRRTWEPRPELRPYVESFELRDDHLGEAQIFNPLPARSDCFLQFHLKEPYRVVTTSTGVVHRSPRRVLVGPHSKRREDLLWTGDLKVFTIRFSEIGLRSIFGVPASAVRDTAISSELVLGSAMSHFESRLAETEDDLMPCIAEEVLLASIARQRIIAGGAAVLRIAAAVRRGGTGLALNKIASRHNLGMRQIERLFQEFAGVSPKVFERLHRSNQALRLKRTHPDWDWSAVAATSGYFDQPHLIREFHSLNGDTPSIFARLGNPANEFRGRSGRS